MQDNRQAIWNRLSNIFKSFFSISWFLFILKKLISCFLNYYLFLNLYIQTLWSNHFCDSFYIRINNFNLKSHSLVRIASFYKISNRNRTCFEDNCSCFVSLLFIEYRIEKNRMNGVHCSNKSFFSIIFQPKLVLRNPVRLLKAHYFSCTYFSFPFPAMHPTSPSPNPNPTERIPALNNINQFVCECQDNNNYTLFDTLKNKLLPFEV